MNKKIVILGAGPSGLVVSNYLRHKGIPFKIISANNHGFLPVELNGIKFTLGQRTLFHNEDLYTFLMDTIKEENIEPAEMTNTVGIYYKNNIHSYPIQNNLENFSIWNRLKIEFSYYLRKRKLHDSEIYAEWVRGNYGNWLADNVILPHTYKTLKEDLFTIYAKFYGKKVIKLERSKNKEPVIEIINQQHIMDLLYKNIEEQHIKQLIDLIHLDKKWLGVAAESEETNEQEYDFNILINTIALPKFLQLLHTTHKGYEEIISVCRDTMRWNNMLVIALLVPTSFVNTDREIVYFPERDYIFSKLYFQRHNGYAVITCELSFREGDKRVQNKAFLNKVYEIVENDLKKSGLITDNTFISYFKTSRLISPAYILCDKEYECNNIFIQKYLEHYGIYNVGRFAEWKPNLRVEDAVRRIRKLYDEGVFE
jgi:protoporphyrinogen oxidase